MGVGFFCYLGDLHWVSEIADSSCIHLIRSVKSHQFNASQKFSRWLFHSPTCFCVTRSLGSGRVKKKRTVQINFRIFSSLQTRAEIQH